MDNFDLNKYLYNNPLLNEIKVNDPVEVFNKLKKDEEIDEIDESLKSKIKKIVKEMSMTGGGTTGATFNAGVGMNYSTPKAFKKIKKKK